MTVRANRVRFLAGILPLVVVILAAFHTKTSAAQKASGTIFYTHGRIYTNDPAQPWAEAMAARLRRQPGRRGDGPSRRPICNARLQRCARASRWRRCR